MPPAVADVGVLRRDDAPAAIHLAHDAGADAFARRHAVLVVQHFAVDPEAGMQDRDIGVENHTIARPPQSQTVIGFLVISRAIAFVETTEPIKQATRC